MALEPIREVVSDNAKERAMAAFLQEAMKWELFPTPKFYFTDFHIQRVYDNGRENYIGDLEIKWLNSSSQYPAIFPYNKLQILIFENMERIYLDNAATTSLDPAVLEAMMPYMTTHFGNPSSIHADGRGVRTKVEEARKTVAKLLNTSPSEIFFTSGGTEADNMAIRCTINDLGIKHAITTRIEHHAVVHTLEELAQEGLIKLSFVQLDEKGSVDMLHLAKLLAENERSLVSLMEANNEIGNLIDLSGDLITVSLSNLNSSVFNFKDIALTEYSASLAVSYTHLTLPTNREV